ncbi:MAG: biotin/lipoyl-containing protein [Flavobacteriales bacterium]
MAREIQWDDVRVDRRDSLQLADDDAQWTSLGPRTWSVLRDGKRFKVECEEGPDAEGHLVVRINGVRKAVRVMDERTKLLEKMGMSVKAGAATGDVKAPMPGKVLQVLVKPGDAVEEGQSLLVLEAMKMENVIKAVLAGEVSKVPISEGQAVEKGALLIGFDA